MVELDAWKISVSAGIDSLEIISKCKMEKENENNTKDEIQQESFRNALHIIDNP